MPDKCPFPALDNRKGPVNILLNRVRKPENFLGINSVPNEFFARPLLGAKHKIKFPGAVQAVLITQVRVRNPISVGMGINEIKRNPQRVFAVIDQDVKIVLAKARHVAIGMKPSNIHVLIAHVVADFVLGLTAIQEFPKVVVQIKRSAVVPVSGSFNHPVIQCDAWLSGVHFF